MSLTWILNLKTIYYTQLEIWTLIENGDVKEFLICPCLNMSPYSLERNTEIFTDERCGMGSEVKVKVAQLCSILCDPMDCSPWNSPGQNTGVGSLSLLQGIFPAQGSNPGLPHCRQIFYQLSHKGSPMIGICFQIMEEGVMRDRKQQ